MGLGVIGPQGVTVITPPAREKLSQIGQLVAGDGSTGFAAFGLPGFSGFIAVALVIFGAVVIYLWAGIITFGIFVTVGYILWMLNRIVFSDPDPEKEVTEAPWSDLIAPILMMIPVILLGIWPDLVLDFTQAVVTFIIGGIGP